MHRTRKIAAAALLVASAVGLGACGNSFGADTASSTSKKFWDRCLGTQCPPMNSDDDAPKPKPKEQ